MNTKQYPTFLKLLVNCLYAILSVGVVTGLLFLVGRSVLGEGVIALLYLLPIVGSAGRWGRLPGISAALAATLCFDFLFIPPFYTFAVGSLEGWLILAIFLAVTLVVVERIQASFASAHEAALMYELSAALSSQRTQEAIALTVARQIQQLFQAELVNVNYWSNSSSKNTLVSHPRNVEGKGKPDLILPIQNTFGLEGEIQIWAGVYMPLPSADSRLLQNYAWQAGRAFERAQPLAFERAINEPTLQTSER